jgi:hypothetical protein
MTATAERKLCRHCRQGPLDWGQPESGLCAHCLDLAVWGAECPWCNRVPTGKPHDHCD